MNDDGIIAALRAEHALQPSPLRDASQEGFELDAGVQDGNAAVRAEGAVEVGKGWGVGGALAWTKGMGAAAWAKLTWTPKAKP